MLAIAASHDWNVIQLDVETAFLQGEMKEDVYAKQPNRFEKLDLNGQPYVCKLKKSLYGLEQSPRNWHGTIQHELITEGFKACVCGPCVDVKDDSSSKVFIVLCRRPTRHRIVRGRYFQDQDIPDDQIRN